MLNGDPSFPPPTNVTLTTEQIQKYLEENKQLILAILEGQNMGKFTDVVQFQAKLQHNLTYLATLADVQQKEQTHSQPLPSQFEVQQGLGMQHSPVAVSQQQPDLLALPFQKNNQQEQQQHVVIPVQQSDLSTSKLPFQMNDQQQQHRQSPYLQQQQSFPVPMSSLPGTNRGIYQASQTRLGINLSETQENNQIGLDAGLGWSLGKPPFGRNSGSTGP